jgi:hypothetical protein
MKKFFYYSLIYISVYFLPASIIQSQQISADLKTLTKNSEVVLIGKVSKQESKWNKNKSAIYTDVTIEVDEYLKGQRGEKSITVSHLGGEVGEVGELYTHIPTFKEQEEMLLFVNMNKNDGKFQVYNGDNGKIEIMENNNSKEKYTKSNKKIDDLRKEIKAYLAE